MSRPRITIVTGTDTGVGKTVAVAALAARAVAEGRRVVVVKPVQTGIGGDEPDVADAVTVRALTGVPTEEYTALDDPLAPDTAARRQGVHLPAVATYADPVVALAELYDDVLVEGAGGLLVRLDSDGGTLLDLQAAIAKRLAERGASQAPDVVVVTRAGLGTLNHTELTVRALRAHGVEPAGLVVGSWPDEPGLAEQCNRDDLPHHTGVPVVAVVPGGAGALSREEFLATAPRWFAV